VSPPPVDDGDLLTGTLDSPAPAPPAQSPARPGHPARRRGLSRAAALGARAAGGPALAVTYLSLLVLLPLAAVVSTAFDGGPSAFWAAVSQPESVAALKLTLLCSLGVAVFNSFAGVLIAWVMVRDTFPGKRIVNGIIDLPFALPTIVAGLTLLSLYGPGSPFGVNVAGTRAGIVLALAFVTLPFSVRTVQPVIAELDRETEEAAASLGATPSVVLRRIVFPSIAPAMLAGAGLAFARAVGEFGSVILISGDLPYKTEVASAWIYSLSQSDALPSAAAVSTVLVALALVLLLAMGWLRRRFDLGVGR
jgi:sulfate/thiosulfate transport system permease protein